MVADTCDCDELRKGEENFTEHDCHPKYEVNGDCFNAAFQCVCAMKAGQEKTAP